jgi:hypothetical protein
MAKSADLILSIGNVVLRCCQNSCLFLPSKSYSCPIPEAIPFLVSIRTLLKHFKTLVSKMLCGKAKLLHILSLTV